MITSEKVFLNTLIKGDMFTYPHDKNTVYKIVDDEYDEYSKIRVQRIAFNMQDTWHKVNSANIERSFDDIPVFQVMFDPSEQNNRPTCG